MDKYQKIIKEINAAINNLIQELAKEKDYSNNYENTITAYKEQQEILESKLNANQEIFAKLVNIPKNRKKAKISFILYSIIHFLIVALITGGIIFLTSAAYVGIIGALVTTILVKHNYNFYKNETNEMDEFQQKYDSNEIEAAISELTSAIAEIISKLNMLTKKQDEALISIDSIQGKIKTMNYYKREVTQRRMNRINQLTPKIEVYLDQTFERDIEAIKLERKLKDGENI